MNPQLNPTATHQPPADPNLALLFARPAAATAKPKASSVKRYLRHRQTRKYFCEDGWTEDLAQARTFEDALAAAAVCATYKLVEVELALRVGTSDNDLFCTPLS